MRVLYIDIDSLRPDHLGCMGYHRNTSPCIDQVAAEGVRFSGFFAPDAPCLPSRTAFFTGRPGIITGVVNHGGLMSDTAPQGASRSFRASLSEETLASSLRKAGVYTCSISPFPNRHSAYQVWHGFHETHDTGGGGLDNADHVYPYAERWLRSRGHEDNWFLHVNFWDPHTPYDAPAEFGNPFADDPIDPWLTQEIIDAQNASYGPHSAHEVPGLDETMSPKATLGVGRVKDLEDAKAHIDGYDTGIRYVDGYVGRLMELLRDLGIEEETAVIISSDHGENQGELNVWGDHQTADLITSRIPLIIKWPGRTDSLKGSLASGFFYNFDLGAALIEWMGGRVPESWEGKALALEGEGRQSLVLSQGSWSCQRSVRWDRWILIRTYHTGWKEFPEHMLFDAEDDPHQTRNLASSRPDLVGHGLTLLDQWMGEMMGKGLRGDPFWTVIQEGGPHHANDHDPALPGYLQRLRETGRAEKADQLERLKGRPVPG